MSNGAERPSYHSPPQHIFGLLNHYSHQHDPDSLHSTQARAETGLTPRIEPPQHSPPQQYDAETPPTPTEAKARLRKACDSCSVRKVKCDESGPPCRSCAALDIPCTFERPTRRRGPPNKHAEAIKRQKLEQGAVTTSVKHDTAPETVVTQLSVESICPLPILELLLDDYFTYIHPLIPLPHEPTFRMQLQRRDDLTDNSFLALVANMVAALVASFPRRPRQLLTSLEMRKRFPSAGALIDICQRVAADARGAGYLYRKLNLYDALSSYLSAITLAYTYELRGARLLLGEAMLILRNLNMHRADAPAISPSAYASQNPENTTRSEEEKINYIDQEMNRRFFWVNFVSNRHIRQLGPGDTDVLIPPLSGLSITDRPPDLPLEVDDEYIFSTHIAQQPPGVVSQITGFNTNVKVTVAWDDLVAIEGAVGLAELHDIDLEKRILVRCLKRVKHATDAVPRELLMQPASSQGYPSLENPHSHRRRGDSWPEDDLRYSGDRNPPTWSRRRVQLEIQKANIYSTQIATRSYLAEKYWGLCGLQEQMNSRSPIDTKQDSDQQIDDRADPLANVSDADQQEMSQERSRILQDLALLLSSINQVNMEPNGISFNNKIRAIAGTLLPDPSPKGLVPPLFDYDTMQRYLHGFIDILMKLERLGPGLSNSSSTSGDLVGVDATGESDASVGGGSGWGHTNEGLTAEDIEERELVQWASLKEHQERFAMENGYTTSL